MSHYHSGYNDGAAVERGEKPGYNEEQFTDAGYRNGLRNGRARVIEDRDVARIFKLVTLDVEGKDGIHLGGEDPVELMPICGAGADVELEKVTRSDKRDATCQDCLTEARNWAKDAS